MAKKRTYRVPQEIKKIVQRAIEENMSRSISQRASYKEQNGKKIPGTGMRTARKLMSGQVDEKQLRLMSAWFARHGASEKEKEARKDKTSKASLAFALWGGNPARSWVRMTLKQIDKDM
jgi:hypothetical protein|tara:strand:- start:243 stop:599 length:357 start_codon:yes stop_codon:yes gene_type:complete